MLSSLCFKKPFVFWYPVSTLDEKQAEETHWQLTNGSDIL